MISSAVTALMFAAVLTTIGMWGRRSGEKQVLSTLSPAAQRAKARSIRRGAIACLLGGLVFLVLGVTEVVIWFTHR
jgi:hypothetical protein